MKTGAPVNLPLDDLRVLIVEDRYLIASELEVEVRKLGATVAGVVGTLKAAEDLAAQAGIDVALLDVNLNGEMVFPLAQLLADKGVPFIFLTGYDDWVLPPQWRDRPHLRKPVHVRALCEALCKLGLPHSAG